MGSHVEKEGADKEVLYYCIYVDESHTDVYVHGVAASQDKIQKWTLELILGADKSTTINAFLV